MLVRHERSTENPHRARHTLKDCPFRRHGRKALLQMIIARLQGFVVVVTARYCGIDRLKWVLTSRRCRPVNAALERPSWPARTQAPVPRVSAPSLDRQAPDRPVICAASSTGELPPP